MNVHEIKETIKVFKRDDSDRCLAYCLTVDERTCDGCYARYRVCPIIFTDTLILKEKLK